MKPVIHPSGGVDHDAVFASEQYLFFSEATLFDSDRRMSETSFLTERLQLRPTHSVLDVACGVGTHSVALAPYVKDVLGLDASENFLGVARNDAIARGATNARFMLQDVRTLNLNSSFDVALLINTVYGLFSDDENRRLLRAVSRALHSGGKVCLDVINRDTVLVDFQSDFVFEKEGQFLLDRCTFDERSGRIVNRRIYLRNGRIVDAPFSLRTYNLTELTALLNEADLQIIDVFADWHGTPMNCHAKKMVLIASKSPG